VALCRLNPSFSGGSFQEKDQSTSERHWHRGSVTAHASISHPCSHRWPARVGDGNAALSANGRPSRVCPSSFTQARRTGVVTFIVAITVYRRIGLCAVRDGLIPAHGDVRKPGRTARERLRLTRKPRPHPGGLVGRGLGRRDRGRGECPVTHSMSYRLHRLRTSRAVWLSAGLGPSSRRPPGMMRCPRPVRRGSYRRPPSPTGDSAVIGTSTQPCRQAGSSSPTMRKSSK
jgi:hypothetical protein